MGSFIEELEVPLARRPDPCPASVACPPRAVQRITTLPSPLPPPQTASERFSSGYSRQGRRVKRRVRTFWRIPRGGPSVLSPASPFSNLFVDNAMAPLLTEQHEYR